MESIVQELLENCGAEIISSAPERPSVIQWSGFVAIIVIVVGTFLGALVYLYNRDGCRCGHHFNTASGLMVLVALVTSLALLLNPQTLGKAIVKKEPTGKTLYTVVASDQTDMATLQQNFDIVENVAYRTFIVRIKDESVVKADSDTSRTWWGLAGGFS